MQKNMNNLESKCKKTETKFASLEKRYQDLSDKNSK